MRKIRIGDLVERYEVSIEDPKILEVLDVGVVVSLWPRGHDYRNYVEVEWQKLGKRQTLHLDKVAIAGTLNEQNKANRNSSGYAS